MDCPHHPNRLAFLLTGWSLPVMAAADDASSRVDGTLTLAALGVLAIANGCRCLARNRRRGG